MFVPILMLTIGGILVYSALEGLSVTDILSGKTGKPLSPGGHPAGSSSSSSGGDTSTGGSFTAPAGEASTFKGSHANELSHLASVAQNQFGLTITSTNGGGHVPTSLHYADEAFDASGPETAMKGFAQYVADNYGNEISELIHNPGFAIKNGQVVEGSVFYAAVWAGHRNHVHVGWS